MTAHAGDDLACFQNALAQRDGGYAVHHLAGLVAEGATAQTRAAVADFVAA